MWPLISTQECNVLTSMIGQILVTIILRSAVATAFLSFSCINRVFVMPRHPRNRVPPRPRPERDGFVAPEGFGLVDLSYLAAQLEPVALCAKCTKGHLRLKIGVNRMGFAIPLLFECTNR